MLTTDYFSWKSKSNNFVTITTIVKIVKKYADPQTTTPTNNREKFEPLCYISSVRYKQRIIH